MYLEECTESFTCYIYSQDVTVVHMNYVCLLWKDLSKEHLSEMLQLFLQFFKLNYLWSLFLDNQWSEQLIYGSTPFYVTDHVTLFFSIENKTGQCHDLVGLMWLFRMKISRCVSIQGFSQSHTWIVSHHNLTKYTLEEFGQIHTLSLSGPLSTNSQWFNQMYWLSWKWETETKPTPTWIIHHKYFLRKM